MSQIIASDDYGAAETLAVSEAELCTRPDHFDQFDDTLPGGIAQHVAAHFTEGFPNWPLPI